MAGEAVISIGLLMFGHKCRVVGSMAIHTGLLVEAEIVAGMAVRTLDRGGGVVYLVPDQAEGCHGMVEAIQTRADGVKICALMVRMAGEAGQFRVEFCV